MASSSPTSEKKEKDLSDSEIWSNCYLIIDFPGQIELYTHSTSVTSLLQHLTLPCARSGLDCRLCSVHLVDSTSIYDAGRFISTCLTSLMSTIRLELPAVNVLTKVDLLRKSAAFDVEFFAECDDLERLVQYLEHNYIPSEEMSHLDSQAASLPSYADNPRYKSARAAVKNSYFHRRHARLMTSVASVIGDFGLLNFKLLSINDASLMGRLLAECDKCSGAAYAYR